MKRNVGQENKTQLSNQGHTYHWDHNITSIHKHQMLSLMYYLLIFINFHTLDEYLKFKSRYIHSII